MNIQLTFQKLAVALVAFIAFASCTKTEILPLEDPLRNRILEYKVINDNEPLFGAIDHDNSTITVYRPYYSGIDLLIPEIKLEAGTILVDADGKEINLDGGLEPVPVDTTTYQYNVLGSDEKVRTYALVIKTQVYPSPLKVGYSVVAHGSDVVNETDESEMVVGGIVRLYGNFESTSTNARFEVKHRATGKSVDDLLSVNKITVQNGAYIAELKTDIHADTGYYDIKMHHQGRTVQLPPLRLNFRKPGAMQGSTNAEWEKIPGDTVTVRGYTNNAHYPYNATLVGLKRVYMKIVWNQQQFAQFPEGFPQSLLDTPIEVEIISYTRDELKIKMPDLPIGHYIGQASSGGHSTLGHQVNSATFGFYFDYEDWTGWGKDNLTAFAREIKVLAK